MNSLISLCLLTLGLLHIFVYTGCQCGDKSSLGIEKISFKGWNDAYKLSNQSVELIIVPSIGRIMHFSFKDDSNILWNNPEFYGKVITNGKPFTKNGNIIWANFGGDKVWPIQESETENINGYRWPPDHWFDGSEHTAEITDGGLKIISPVSEYCGARCIREIIIDPTHAEVLINQTIEKIKPARNLSKEPINFTIWNVTQIRPPLMALFNLNPNSIHPNRVVMMKTQTINNYSTVGNIGILVPDKRIEQKAGADSDFWLAAIVEDVVFGEFFRYLRDKNYPDNGLSAEVYTEPAYTELELLSPLKELQIGESLRFSIKWRIHKLSSENKTNTQKRIAAISWLNTYVELSE